MSPFLHGFAMMFAYRFVFRWLRAVSPETIWLMFFFLLGASAYPAPARYP